VVTAFDFDHASVVGHDMGLILAYDYAAQHPDKVDKLVVVQAPRLRGGYLSSFCSAPLVCGN
jgi:pimeloyl-ACP methyl ester carboxylesterase